MQNASTYLHQHFNDSPFDIFIIQHDEPINPLSQKQAIELASICADKELWFNDIDAYYWFFDFQYEGYWVELVEMDFDTDCMTVHLYL